MTRISRWLRGRVNDDEVEEYGVPGEGVLSLAKRLGVEFMDIVKLDANENFMLPAEFTATELRQLSKVLDTRLYPLDQKTRLTKALAEHLQVNPDQIVLGNSSDDILEITARAFLRGRVSAVSISPTFIMYRVITGNLGHKYIDVPLREDFSLDVEEILTASDKSTHLCYLCSPNNPTGNQFPIDGVRQLAERFDGLLVVDEAYVEFAPYSIVDIIEDYSNIVVLRTFSKAFGLAGLRIGYAVTTSKIATTLRRIQLPYNINVVSLEMASRVLARIGEVRAAIEKVKAERAHLAESLRVIPCLVPYPSDANFVLLKTSGEARQIRDDLAEKGVLVRYYDSPILRNYLRVTVGTREMNDRFLAALRENLDA